jgi:hypothetical protein
MSFSAFDRLYEQQVVKPLVEQAIEKERQKLITLLSDPTLMEGRAINEYREELLSLLIWWGVRK